MDVTLLPFDQYGRYQMIADALDAVRPVLGTQLHVLDVGGLFCTRRGVAMLPAQAFLPNDQVTVLDQPACNLSGYVQGDGRGLAFGDNSFDCVISCDTLEHIPAADRAAFWGELLRVARLGVILIAPALSPQSEAAEELVATFIHTELGEPQPQLAEHRAYGLPNSQLIASMLGELGLRHSSFPSGQLHAWVLMMIARHTRPLHHDADLIEQLDSYYSRFLAANDRCEPAYRRLWLVEKQAQHEGYEAAAAALSTTIRETPVSAVSAWPDLVGWQLQIAALREAAGRSAAQQARIVALEQEVAWRAGQVAALEQCAAWLEQQAQDAQASLARVANGRVLRLLRRVTRNEN